MTRADLFLPFAASFVLAASACSEDSSSPGGQGGPSAVDAATQSTSPATAGDGQITGAASDAGSPDTGVPLATNKDAGGAPAMTMDGGDVEPSDGGIPEADAEAAEAGSGSSAFDECYAALKDCVAKDMNTADLMETPCKSLTNLPVPLSDGGTYGPKTIMAGPYGGQLEWNAGSGTEFVNEVNVLEDICVPIGIETFNEPQEVNAEIENLRGVDWSLYTIFRPACFKDGEKYPVITWANGTCGEIAGYSALLSTVASYGYIVIAANSTWTATAPTDTVQLRALDYAKALNEDDSSIYYQKLDMDNIGAMGHSQGAGATANADSDPRIKSLIFWNTGTSNNKPFLDISGERDVSPTTPQSMASDVNAATKPGSWLYFHKVLQTGGSSTGHLTLMEQPDRVIDLTVAWWDWQLKGDEEAKKMFVGDDCGLCTMPDEFDYGHNSLLQ